MVMKRINTKSIHEVHQLFRLDNPKHPFITVVSFGKKESWALIESFYYVSSLYSISIKGNCPYTISTYGRNTCDFEECSLIFTKPNQVVEVNKAYKTEDENCWTLFFHPDLIRRSQLGRKIYEYSFFDYALNEALHLSAEERNTLTNISEQIIEECSNQVDRHSETLIISNLELLLNYCTRFYERQFFSRRNLNHGNVSRFNTFLRDYFKENMQIESGIPSVEICGQALNMSGKYLSDMLKVETGKSLLQHIHSFVIDRAKTDLLNSNCSVKEVAFSLGFVYPQHFSNIFKAKTGMSPSEYRQLHSKGLESV